MFLVQLFILVHSKSCVRGNSMHDNLEVTVSIVLQAYSQGCRGLQWNGPNLWGPCIGTAVYFRATTANSQRPCACNNSSHCQEAVLALEGGKLGIHPQAHLGGCVGRIGAVRFPWICACYLASQCPCAGEAPVSPILPWIWHRPVGFTIPDQHR